MKLAHSYSSIKLFENCPLRYYRQRILKDVQDQGGEASIYGERIHEALELRLRENKPLPPEAAQYEDLCVSIERNLRNNKLYLEKELVLDENLEPTGWWDPDAWLRSKLDVLIDKGDKAVVFDWKTGRKRADQFQMEIFAVQVFKHFPDVQEVLTSLIWLKDGSSTTHFYSRAHTNELWAEIIGRIRRIYAAAETDVWPARPSGLCPYCPARHDCPHARF
jgi:RecB family exonuclease